MAALSSYLSYLSSALPFFCCIASTWTRVRAEPFIRVFRALARESRSYVTDAKIDGARKCQRTTEQLFLFYNIHVRIGPYRDDRTRRSAATAWHERRRQQLTGCTHSASSLFDAFLSSEVNTRIYTDGQSLASDANVTGVWMMNNNDSPRM